MAVIEIAAELDCLHPSPVRLPAARLEGKDRDLLKGPVLLKEEGGTRILPAQRDGDALVILVAGLAAGQKRRYRLEKAPAARGVTLQEEGPHRLAVVLPEGHFTTYHFDPANPRPFCWPVHGPGQKQVTRSYPMLRVEAEIAAKDDDHPHHRSFWTAYDEVNGVDNWSEAKEKHGWTRHQRFEARSEGLVFGAFTALSTWLSHDQQKKVLDERRTLRVYNAGAERRLLDYEIELIAAYEDVEYGDTKEGGIMAWRVLHTMKGRAGGLMENSNGQKTEKEVWGKRAAWLDYSGTVEGEILGIAMMDHPGNLNHPCYWHARDYGLVGTNPFAKAAFEGGAERPWHQKKGETLRFRYRVLIHRGRAAEGDVDDAYHAWIQPPAARVVG